jgi:hypothetical protein
MVLFLETFDPVQLRYAGKEWRMLVEYTETMARTSGSVRQSKHAQYQTAMLTVIA